MREDFRQTKPPRSDQHAYPETLKQATERKEGYLPRASHRQQSPELANGKHKFAVLGDKTNRPTIYRTD